MPNNKRMSFHEFKCEVALVLIEQEENVAFPTNDMMREHWYRHVGDLAYQPQHFAVDWYNYCMAHS